jgi:hypothetical protein
VEAIAKKSEVPKSLKIQKQIKRHCTHQRHQCSKINQDRNHSQLRGGGLQQIHPLLQGA